MKRTTWLAAGVAVAALLAVPVTAAAEGTSDSYTVVLDPTSAHPGDSVTVTATDSFGDGSNCGNSPYTITIGYTKVGGTEASANVGEGLTDSDTAEVDASITVPADAASTDASGVNASVDVVVDCHTQQLPQRRNRAVRAPALVAPSTAAALTITAFTGTIKLSPTFAFRGTDEDVTLDNCQGGPISASFMSYGHEKTDITVTDAGSDTATGSFTVANDTTYGPGAVSGLCWQTSYADKKLFVGNEEEEGTGTGSSGGGGQVVHKHPVAVAGHAVDSTPTFTG
jgi:hypothetical protein